MRNQRSSKIQKCVWATRGGDIECKNERGWRKTENLLKTFFSANFRFKPPPPPHTHTYPVSGVSSHRYGNPGVLADGPFVSDCRCRPFLHLGGFTGREREREDQWETKRRKINLKLMSKEAKMLLWEALEGTEERASVFFFHLKVSLKREREIDRWPFRGNERLELPLILLWVEGQSVHDFVLLLWRDEVLYDQIPAGRQRFSLVCLVCHICKCEVKIWGKY